MPQFEPDEVQTPWGDLFAEVQIADDKFDWVPVCPVYHPIKQPGSIVFTMHTEPLAWRNSDGPRTMMIVKRKEKP